MKIKQSLYLLIFLGVIISSCKDDLVDYREKYEGIYAFSIKQEWNFEDFNPSVTIPYDTSGILTVERFGDMYLMLIIGNSGTPVAVDDAGNLSGLVGDNFPGKALHPQTNDTIRLNYGIKFDPPGTITETGFHLVGTYSGTATMKKVDNTTEESEIAGTIVYDGTRLK